MSNVHTVGPGEHLPGIAAKYGFSSINGIWNHPENAELKRLRKNPNILFEGDRVFVPDKQEKLVSAETEVRHRFELEGEALELHVKVHDQGFRPIHGDAVLNEGTGKTSMRQNGDIFEATISPTTASAGLEFPISKTARQRPGIPVQPGRLDPLETLPGQQQRLNNLGYFAGFVKTQVTDAKKVDQQFRWAVEEFQCDHMGPKQVDGVLGPATLKKLEEVHGC